MTPSPLNIYDFYPPNDLNVQRQLAFEQVEKAFSYYKSYVDSLMPVWRMGMGENANEKLKKETAANFPLVNLHYQAAPKEGQPFELRFEVQDNATAW